MTKHYSPKTSQMERCSNPANCLYGDNPDAKHFADDDVESAKAHMEAVNNRKYGLLPGSLSDAETKGTYKKQRTDYTHAYLAEDLNQYIEEGRVTSGHTAADLKDFAMNNASNFEKVREKECAQLMQTQIKHMEHALRNIEVDFETSPYSSPSELVNFAMPYRESDLMEERAENFKNDLVEISHTIGAAMPKYLSTHNDLDRHLQDRRPLLIGRQAYDDKTAELTKERDEATKVIKAREQKYIDRMKAEISDTATVIQPALNWDNSDFNKKREELWAKGFKQGETVPPMPSVFASEVSSFSSTVDMLTKHEKLTK